MGSTKLQRLADDAALETRRAIGKELRRLRLDAGLTVAAVAIVAGIDATFLARIERGKRASSVAVLTRVAVTLGADLSLRAYPTTGPRVHDRFQAPMVDGLIRVVDRRWTPEPELPVTSPVRGVIDLGLADAREALLVASEFQSEIRRLEQQIRWHREKEAALPSSDVWPLIAADGEPRSSRLLVLRSTAANRTTVARFEATLAAAYPARCVDVVAALTTPDAPWPGPGIAWMLGDTRRAELLPEPPRGVALGR